MTLNFCRKLWRSAWFRNTVPLQENSTFTIQEKSDIFYTVLELPAKYRIVIHLYYYENLSVKEMSTILHLKESTITSQLCRARNLLKEKLEGAYTYDFI
ncbi:sigma factor-like helix-turn-helix DNA-binding protein [Cellulosilyticum sp. I15G10I2]|uniref:sigma factor-like helix-turn-helix DNA-binding protein n=1 Tax=Cellulosilyticum sp. I15G10I2 TaxID=1892843 RepID=UPI001FA7E051